MDNTLITSGLNSDIKTKLMKQLDDRFTISYSGADLRVIVTATYPEDELIIPRPVLLNTLTGVSVSTHRDIFPVRGLGTSNPIGMAYGNRTIAGSLIFAQLGEYGIRDILKQHILRFEGTEYQRLSKHPTMSPYSLTGVDEIPPINLGLTFVNENGDSAAMQLYGVKMLDEGESFMCDDQEWYTTISYMAMAKTPIRLLSQGQTNNTLSPPDAEKVKGIVQGRLRSNYRTSSPWGEEFNVLDDPFMYNQTKQGKLTWKQVWELRHKGSDWA